MSTCAFQNFFSTLGAKTCVNFFFCQQEELYKTLTNVALT
jgi:hypothetical protein